MTGGSSGGPWIANYGVNAALNGVNYGSNSDRNIIVVGTVCQLISTTLAAPGWSQLLLVQGRAACAGSSW